MGRLFWENVLRLFLGRGRLFQGGCFKEGVWGGLFGGGGGLFRGGLSGAAPGRAGARVPAGAERSGGGGRGPLPQAGPGASRPRCRTGEGPFSGTGPAATPRRRSLRDPSRDVPRYGPGAERAAGGWGGGGRDVGVPQKRGAARPWRGPGRRYRGGTRGPGQDGAPG